MNCKVIHLKAQKYLGIKTKINFSDHDEVNFHQLHLDVLNSGIKHREESGHFMAMDSEFTKDHFCYTPLVPVTAFGQEGFFEFTREEGDYYHFNVKISELGPMWFQACAKYIKENDLKIDRRFDLEFYEVDYIQRACQENFNIKEETIELIFRKSDRA